MKTIEYLEWNTGNKQTLVFIHGYADSASMFLPLKSFFPDKHLIAINLPMNQNTHKIYNVKALAEYVMSITKKLNITGYDLLGFSLGGLVAVEVASKDKNVRKLALLNSFPCLVVNTALRTSLTKLIPVVAKKAPLKLFSAANNSDVLRKILGAKKLTNETKTYIKNHNFSVLRTLLACLSYDGLNQYKDLNIPKIIVLFEDDRVLSYKKFSRYAMKNGIETISMKRGGHNSDENYWNSMFETLKKFLL